MFVDRYHAHLFIINTLNKNNIIKIINKKVNQSLFVHVRGGMGWGMAKFLGIKRSDGVCHQVGWKQNVQNGLFVEILVSDVFNRRSMTKDLKVK